MNKFYQSTLRNLIRQGEYEGLEVVKTEPTQIGILKVIYSLIFRDEAGQHYETEYEAGYDPDSQVVVSSRCTLVKPVMVEVVEWIPE